MNLKIALLVLTSVWWALCARESLAARATSSAGATRHAQARAAEPRVVSGTRAQSTARLAAQREYSSMWRAGERDGASRSFVRR